MKIAWLTPLSRRSGISKYSISVLSELSKRVDVEVWAKNMPDNISLNDKLPVFDAVLNDENIKRLNYYDAVIYNMGNNLNFHYEVYQFYRKVKGIVVLHDKVMHNFFAGYFLDILKKPDRYVSTMNYYYSNEGQKIAELSLKTPLPIWETNEVGEYPLFEPCLWNAHGIIVHSKETLKLISDRIPAIPSTCIYHPTYLYNYEYNNKPLLSKKDLKIPDEKIILLFSGVINKSKRVHAVLKAISKDDDIKNKIYFIITGSGNPDYVQYLKNFISTHHLDDIVRFTGFLDDYTLHSYIKNADICINLRFPSTESCSGSLIEQLYFRKPVIVTKIGFHDEIPDDAVVKVDLKDEMTNLEHALKRLINDEGFRASIAEKGFRFASENFSLENYVERFLNFVDIVTSKKVHIDFIDRISDEISMFIIPKISEDFIKKLTGEIPIFPDTEDLSEVNLKPGKEGKTVVPTKNRKDIFKARIISFAWRYRYFIKKIPFLNSISKRLYYSLLDGKFN